MLKPGDRIAAKWTEDSALETAQKIYDIVANNKNVKSLEYACNRIGRYKSLYQYIKDTFKGESARLINEARAIIRERNGHRMYSNRKLTIKDVRQIRSDRERGDTVPTIANRYGVSEGCIKGVVNGYNWKGRE